MVACWVLRHYGAIDDDGRPRRLTYTHRRSVSKRFTQIEDNGTPHTLMFVPAKTSISTRRYIRVGHHRAARP
jgi:hypothetical protein